MTSEKIGIDSVSDVFPNISLYEIVDSVQPDVSPRSWAYHLAPIGMGHSYAESLTSYFARLAKEHMVTPIKLFYRGQFDSDIRRNRYVSGLVETNARKATAQINGSGLTAENWVAMVEEITLQKSLRFLTFLTWRPVFNKSMCRPERAWCPSCLEDQRLAGAMVYEQLIWTHKNVQLCSTHGIPLETKCSHCQANSWVLCGNSRPGICRSCSRWLGHYSNKNGPSFGEVGSNEAGYEMFVAKQVGELISMAPSLSIVPALEVPKASIMKCAEKYFDGNLCSFVRFFGSDRAVTYSLWAGKPRVAPFDLLLRIGFRTGIDLMDLLTKEDSLDSFNPLSTLSNSSKRLSPRLKTKTVLKELFAALEESPSPSLKEVATRLGYKSTRSLRSINAQLCNQITANYNQRAEGRVKRTYKAKIKDPKVIKLTLENSLKESFPPSLGEIAKQFGYSDAQGVRNIFPLLCKALAKKRREFESHRREQIEGQLQQALSSDPPMPLDAVAKKLGYKTNSVLRTKYPKLCRKIRDRCEKYNKKQFVLRVKNAVESILVESPPPPVKVALKRVGVSDSFFKIHFPKEYRAITTRYLEHRKKQAEQNRENERSKIRSIIQDLIKHRAFPSLDAMKKVYITRYLDHSEVWSTILQVREELGFRV